VILLLQLFLLCGLAHAATPQAEFAEHLIAAGLKGGYQVTIADLNKDGKPDIIALASGMSELVWFENPDWKRHVLATDLSHMINLAAWDTDGDGIPEIVLAHEFANEAKNSVGILSVLQHGPDPAKPWKVTEIDRIPTSHRLRWADIYGNGKKVLMNSPLTGLQAEKPEYRGKTPLVFYKPGVWMRETIPQENEGVAHGIYITDWDGSGRDDILTASFVGLDLFRLGKDGVWTRTELAKGDPSPWPKSGSSDVAVGWIGGKPSKTRFLTAIEPWHGNLVSVYRQDKQGRWQRQVIDDALDQGHTILTADLNGDGTDEIIAGFRGKVRGVNIYYANGSKGERWINHPLDNGGIAASSCAVADLNADGRLDIVCIGSATANLKWYENKGARK
jgi:FG-GAP-like repeat